MRQYPTPPAPAPTPVVAPAPVVQPPAAPFVKVDIDEKIIAHSESDQNLADMANKLEASLRRPNEPRFTESPIPARAEPMTPPPRTPEPKPARAETKAPQPEAKPKALYDSLEEEMASLLGRPPGKT